MLGKKSAGLICLGSASASASDNGSSRLIRRRFSVPYDNGDRARSFCSKYSLFGDVSEVCRYMEGDNSLSR